MLLRSALETYIYLKKEDGYYGIENVYQSNPANFSLDGKTKDYYEKVFSQILSTFKFTN